MPQLNLEDIFGSIQNAIEGDPVSSFSKLLRFGEHKSKFRDEGLDFYQIREYDPETDSASQIDWSLKEPDGTVYVREARLTKEFKVIVLADLSSSVFFSAGYPFKLRLLLETLGNLGLACASNHDPLGLVGFSDEIIFDESPKTGSDNLYHLIEQLHEYINFMLKDENLALNRATDFFKAFDFLCQRYESRCFVVVISDFVRFEEVIGSEILRNAAEQHEIIFIFLDDPTELDLRAPFGYLRRMDMEKGTIGVVSLRKLPQIAAEVRLRRKKLLECLKDIEIESVVIEYGKHLDIIYGFLLARQEALTV